MLRFKSAGTKCWQKPLVLVDEHPMPAELAVLAAELRANEAGAWLNSRKLASGVAELQLVNIGSESAFRTRRISLPIFVASALATIFQAADVVKGVPDLVIWRTDEETFRLVEVKCRHWDVPTKEQKIFMRVTIECGIPTMVVEWELEGGAA